MRGLRFVAVLEAEREIHKCEVIPFVCGFYSEVSGQIQSSRPPPQPPIMAASRSDSRYINIVSDDPFANKFIPFEMTSKEGIESFSEELELQFFDYICSSKKRKCFDVNKRRNFIWFIENPTNNPRDMATWMKAQNTSHKHQALKFYDVSQGQLYRMADANYGVRYQVTDQDAFKIIVGTYTEL